MRLLVTGATGFVGRNLLLTAFRAGTYEEIIAAVRDPAKLRAQLAAEPNLAPLANSIRTVTWNDFTAIGPVDHAVHAAGVLFARDRESYFRVNVDDTRRLLDALDSSTRLLVLSSQSAGGPTPAGRAARSISDPDHPITLYGESKLAMEAAVLELRPGAHIWRPPMILGPRDTATLPLFKMASGPLQIKPGLAPKTFSWIAVTDLVQAILATLTSPDWPATTSRPQYVAAPDIITDEDLIQTAVALRGRQPRLLRLPNPLVRLLSATVDAIPPLRTAAPSLTRDRAREIQANRWVVDAQEFQATHANLLKTSLTESLAATHHWFIQTKQIN